LRKIAEISGGRMPPQTSLQYELGPFRVDPVRRRLFKGDVLVPLTPKVFELLLAFVERPGELLTKDALLSILWPDVAVEENNLTHAMAKLRKALGDDIHERRFIVTVSGQGYRFVADVRPIKSSGDGAGDSRQPASAHTPVTRLLVLPFKALRPRSDYEFLAFSVPDAITSSLCGFESIAVRSSAAAARFATEPLALDVIAADADVDAVLHGTLLEGEDDVRVNAQLLRVPDGTVLWSGMAQAPRGDVFQLQDTLTRRIVDGLAVQLTARDRHLLRTDVPTSGRAYELYLRANKLSYDPRHLHAARDLYVQSVAEDPAFAPAWARLGRVYRVIGKFESEDVPQSLALGEAAFKRALDLNPELAVAHGLYAHLEADLGRAQDAMVRLLRHPAIAKEAELLAGLVHVCRYCGLLDESVAAHDRARRIDPIVRTSVAHTFWALREFQKAIEADVDNPSYVPILAIEAMGRTADAIVLAQEALRRPNIPHTARVFLSAWAATFAGDRDAALSGVDDCERLNFPDPEAVYRIGWMLARLRHEAGALTMLRRAVEQGFVCPFHMSADPWFEPLRGRDEFQETLALARQKQAGAQAAFAALRGYEILGIGVGHGLSRIG
jgi:DNA-binding winged helix-turn-helix (wHTH) protein/tetratricopeptide (TPR) repeat protein